MSYYHRNRTLARTENNEPSLTDQSQAEATDINIIVRQFGITGRVPGYGSQPLPPADYTQLPTDLRGFIEQGRGLQHLHAALPEKLRDMPIEQLLQSTPQQLAELLKPPAPPEKEPKE